MKRRHRLFLDVLLILRLVSEISSDCSIPSDPFAAATVKAARAVAQSVCYATNG